MRGRIRFGLLLLVLTAAIVVPFVLSGYSDLDQARTATSHLEAAKLYQSAALRIPWRPDLYELAGHHYYYAKDYASANAAYQKAFRRHALSADGWVAWGDVNYLIGNADRAAQIWEQGLDQPNPSEKLYSRLAQIYKEKQDYAKAAEFLQRYVSNHLDDASARYRLGLLLTLTEPNTAASELIAASQLNPDLDPAAQTLRTALNLASVNESPSARFVIIGRGLALVSEWELAKVAFEKATQLDGNNAEAWAWIGEADQQTGGRDALTYLDRALGLDPNSSVVRVLRGLYFQRVGNNREALTEFQTASVLKSDDPALYVSIGESYSKLGDLINALTAYQYATTLAPDDSDYWRILAQFCAQNNIHIKDVGVPAAQQAVVLKQDDPDLLDLLGWLLVLDQRNTEGERTLRHALELDSQNASAHFHLGMLYLETGKPDLAHTQLVQARDLGSTDAQLVLNQYFP